VVASDGKTGDQREIAYTNCKVIGNGSFGVVFQAKMVQGAAPGADDQIAIKKVLQDKRFKVGPLSAAVDWIVDPARPSNPSTEHDTALAAIAAVAAAPSCTQSLALSSSPSPSSSSLLSSPSSSSQDFR